LKYLNLLVKVLSVSFWVLLGMDSFQRALDAPDTLLRSIQAVNVLLFGVFIFLRRDEKSKTAPLYIQIPILFSIFIGNYYRSIHPTPVYGAVLSFAGSFLTIWSLLSLGRSFGIAPADRGLVVHGPYKFIRHPMYAGYLLIDLPVLIWNATPWNLGVFFVKASVFVIRILLEERVVSGYSEYVDKVKWRLLPYVW